MLLLPDKQEEFLLRNYCKSIRHLQLRFHDTEVHSMRIILTTCLVFVYLELLRGTYKRAYDHLNGGLQVLAALNNETIKKPKDTEHYPMKVSSHSNHDRIDAFLTEAFTRLRTQMEFSVLRSDMSSTFSSRLPPNVPVLKFSSIYEARHYLDRVFESIKTLLQPMQNGSYARWSDDYWNTVLTEQRFTRASLDSWLRSLIATITDTSNCDELKGYSMLRVYHTMAEIMIATCLSPEQTVFDQHISGFKAIVTQCNDIASEDAPRRATRSDSHVPDNSRHSWPDLSWNPPLYYTAIKCRNHQIRIGALNLMSSFWPYEIVWDLGILNTSNVVAREVIQMEEGDFFEVKTSSHSKLSLSHKEASLDPSSSTLPEEQRFDTVDMVLFDNIPGSIQIECRKRVKEQVQITRKVYNQADGTWEKIYKEASCKSRTIAHRL